MDITITDADYQAVEREQAQELLALRRERTVFIRRIGELMVLIGQLSERLEAASSVTPSTAPKKRGRRA